MKKSLKGDHWGAFNVIHPVPVVPIKTLTSPLK